MEEYKDHDLLVRIDERTQNMHERMTQFVTRKEFTPVRNIAFGLVGLILVAFIGAMINLIIK